MKRLQAYKFELMPNGAQVRAMRQYAGACRFVYNKALAWQNAQYQADNTFKFSYTKIANLLPQWKEELDWLKDAPSQPLQQSLKNLEASFRHFFAKRTDFPRFKKKGQSDSFRFPQDFQVEQHNNRVFLPKFGWIRYQCALSHKVKFSNNWKKQKARITQLHSTIANIRKDTLHKTTTTISQNHAMIVIEDLQISNMSRSAKGTATEKGRNVRQKSGLNRSILDQGWFEFRRQLEYKQQWLGGEVLAVPAHYTSQRCSCCGTVSKDNRQSQAKFTCVSCGYETNADLNAAKNILAAGHAVLACLTDVADSSAYISGDALYGYGERVQQGRSVKQEPTEGIAPVMA